MPDSPGGQAVAASGCSGSPVFPAGFSATISASRTGVLIASLRLLLICDQAEGAAAR
jgi:hypothetical protein